MSAKPQTLVQDLYAKAFQQFGASCLWSREPVRDPTTAHARIIAHALRVEGGREAYSLAREIEEACDAADLAAA